MTSFFQSAPFWLLAFFWASLVLTLSYWCWKWSARGYIFSPYSIPLLTYQFMLFVVAPFQFNGEAWVVLGQRSASPFVDGLILSLGVNLSGYFIILSVLWFTENRRRPDDFRPPLFRNVPVIDEGVVRALLWVGVVAFTLCLLSVQALPVFGSRTIFEQRGGLRPVYNVANFIILFSTSVLVVKARDGLRFRTAAAIIVGLLCMFLTGGRTSLLSVLELAGMMIVYGRQPGQTRRATFKMFFVLVAIGGLGLFIANLRAKGQAASGVVDTVLYGNTFSDIRDGAFIATGWLYRWGGEFLGGNTYLAGLMSFIPSSLSDFRTQWSWGYFTTTTLWNYPSHYGFRGGWSLETYMNFGVAGVVVFAVGIGWLLGRLERMFSRQAFGSVQRDLPSSYAAGWAGYLIFTVLIASSATYNIFTLVFCLMFIYGAPLLLGQKRVLVRDHAAAA